VPLKHALIEHEIGWHPRLRCGVLPADLLHQGRVVVGLARPLRKRGDTCAQEDDRCRNGYGASAPAAPAHNSALLDSCAYGIG